MKDARGEQTREDAVSRRLERDNVKIIVIKREEDYGEGDGMLSPWI